MYKNANLKRRRFLSPRSHDGKTAEPGERWTVATQPTTEAAEWHVMTSPLLCPACCADTGPQVITWDKVQILDGVIFTTFFFFFKNPTHLSTIHRLYSLPLTYPFLYCLPHTCLCFFSSLPHPRLRCVSSWLLLDLRGWKTTVISRLLGSFSSSLPLWLLLHRFLLLHSLLSLSLALFPSLDCCLFAPASSVTSCCL